MLHVIVWPSHLEVQGGPKMALAALSRRVIDGECAVRLPSNYYFHIIITTHILYCCRVSHCGAFASGASKNIGPADLLSSY